MKADGYGKNRVHIKSCFHMAENVPKPQEVNTFWTRQNGRRFADCIFKYVVLNENV